VKRRTFITMLGGTAMLWPLAARAQQPTMPVIGFLNSGSGSDPYFQNFVTKYRAGLRDAGYTEGQNVAIDFRWAEGHYDRLSALADELVRQQVALIAAGAPPAALAAKAAAGTIPIVFMVGDDPVRLGLVASFNRPGGNATGIYVLIEQLEVKRLGLLREVVPAATMIAVLLNPKSPSFATQSNDLQAGARTSGLQIHILTATSPEDIDRAFATLDQMQAGALMVGSDPSLTGWREQIVGLAARQSLPTMFPWRVATETGGLMSYGINIADGYRQAAGYAGRVLKGEKPADLPVIQSSNFEFVVNLKTARALGMTIPSGVLAIADDVIE
jgi:putative ABC transport system substrate-binding protein